MVRLKRAYVDPEPGDGTRVLVDRLWPRGLRKDAAHFDEWLKGVAPSDELRQWYGHRPEAFDEFRERYRHELAEPDRAAAVEQLRTLAAAGPLTLLTATKQAEISQAAVLVDLLNHG
ncbi:DUF488 domain-containing protein [Nakamurella lactea]|uniref:DUF488 domain-containing protein n=1 Tax=Nakamurella lactea TaxID=459515 RepID=UPI00040A63E7|nr:DUF488 family protein [Nakamurella lactea]